MTLTRDRLVAAYGSPLYVYDLAAVDQAARDLFATLPGGAVLYYSLKANPHPRVAERLRLAGCAAEISSTGELAAALDAGYPAGACLYTGPGKTAVEVDAAILAGVRTFSVESAVDLARVDDAAARHRADVGVLLRVNGGGPVGAGLRMTGTASQFGFDEQELLRTGLPVRPGRVRVTGLHLFALTGARDEDQLISSTVESVATAARVAGALGLPLDVLDLGGGFAAPFATEGPRPAYPRFAAAVAAALDAHLPAWRDGTPRLAFESGRHLTAAAGTLLTTVLDVKQSRGRTFAVLDAGVNVLGGMSGLGRLLPMAAGLTDHAAGLDETPAAGTPDGAAADLVGPLCTPLDVLGRAVVTSARPGDVLAIPNVGAYGLTAGLTGFLSRPAAAEVLVDGGVVVEATRLQTRRVPVPGPAVRRTAGTGTARRRRR